MKKCPFCKQSIEDEAAFCFYCMTPLTEKQEVIPSRPSTKGRWIALLILTAVVAAALVLWWTVEKNSRPSVSQTGSVPVAETATNLAASTVSNNSVPSSKPKTESFPSFAQSQIASADLPVLSVTSKNASSSFAAEKPAVPSVTAPSQVPSSFPESVVSSVTASSAVVSVTAPSKVPTSLPESSISSVTVSSAVASVAVPSQAPSSFPESAVSSAPQVNRPSSFEGESSGEKPAESCGYLYRNAVESDDFYPLSLKTDGAIVITGVKQTVSDGIYEIPQTIDGKIVVAVMPQAFTAVNKTVKQVILPASVKTVWNYAFEKCSNLTHVYLRGKAIYIEGQAFEGVPRFTLHCSADCSDRNFRYYKNIAPNYGAVYEEWNG